MSEKQNYRIMGNLDFLTPGDLKTLNALQRVYAEWAEANAPNASCWLVIGYEPDPLTAAWARAKGIEVKVVGWCPKGQAFLVRSDFPFPDQRLLEL